jgi:hypothetical protein
MRAGLSFFLVLTGVLLCTSTAIAQSAGTAPGFTLVGNLATPRLGHTATLLPDGRVLVAGGGHGPDLIDGYWVVPEAELYDPATASSTSAGTSAHNFHTATLLQSGQVLLAGGESGEVLGPIPTADLYLNVGRFSQTATLLSDGSALVIGGANGEVSLVRLGSAEVYK